MESTMLDQAIAFLNFFNHRGCDKWNSCGDRAVPHICDPLEELEEFEAIAIAEKYFKIHRNSFLVVSSRSTHSDSAATVSDI
jgi:hypothetical protein